MSPWTARWRTINLCSSRCLLRLNHACILLIPHGILEIAHACYVLQLQGFISAMAQLQLQCCKSVRVSRMPACTRSLSTTEAPRCAPGPHTPRRPRRQSAQPRPPGPHSRSPRRSRRLCSQTCASLTVWKPGRADYADRDRQHWWPAVCKQLIADQARCKHSGLLAKSWAGQRAYTSARLFLTTDTEKEMPTSTSTSSPSSSPSGMSSFWSSCMPNPSYSQTARGHYVLGSLPWSRGC